MKCKTCGLEVSKKQITEKGCVLCQASTFERVEKSLGDLWLDEDEDRLQMMCEFFRLTYRFIHLYDEDVECLESTFLEFVKWKQSVL